LPLSLLPCTQNTLPSLLCVLFSSSFIIHTFCCVTGVSLFRGLCWFIPGIAVGIPHAAYLLTCWSVSPIYVWSLHLVAQEPFCFLSVTWHGEDLYWLWGSGC
jgi:hypothetical protein